MAIVGGLLVGVGLGMLLGDRTAWILIGLGAGFIFEHVFEHGSDGMSLRGWPFSHQRARAGT